MSGYSDREILARTLMAEAGNQGPVGMLAAGSAIMNRVNAGGYGQGLQGVIMRPGAFSPWNSVTGYTGGEQGQDMAAIRPTKMAYDIADQLLSGQYESPIGGSTHFYNSSFSNPSWGMRGGGDWLRIKDHVFGMGDQPIEARGPGREILFSGEYATPTAAAPQVPTQGSTTMTMTPDPQPRGGLFSRLFPGMQEDTAASVETDPFANLSRSQRTMLGFAALRDAAAALQGQEGGYFQQALGGFESAKERERLRRQGILQNQVQALQGISVLRDSIAQRIARQEAFGVPVSDADKQQLAQLDQMASRVAFGLQGGEPAQVTPVSAPATGGVAAAPMEPDVVTAGVAPTPPVDVSPLPEAPAVAEPRVAAGPTVTATDAAPVSDEGAQVADLISRRDEITKQRRALAATGGDATSMRVLQLELEQVNRQIADAQAAGVKAAEKALADEDQALKARSAIDQIKQVMEDSNLEGVLGRYSGQLGGSLPGGATAEGGPTWYQRAMDTAFLSEDEADVLGKINQLTAQTFLEAFEALKGGGQITVVEGQTATAALQRLGNRRVTKEDYNQALTELQRVYENALARAEGKPIPHKSITAAEGGAAKTPVYTSPSGIQVFED